MPSNPIGYALKVVFQFLEGGTGKTGLADISIKGWRWTTKVRDGVSITQELENGLYVYLMPAEYNDSADMYIFNAHTDNADVDQQDVAAIQMSFVWVGYGGGANLVTISVDDGADAVSDVRVEIRDSGGHYVTHAMTDGDGDVTFNLDDGTYSVYCRKTGYIFTQPETVTVDEDPEAATISGTAISIPTPASADECYVYDDVGVPSNVDYPNTITATARIVGLPLDYAGRLWSGQTYTATYNSTTGRFFWYLPRNATVYFDVEIGNTETQARYLKKISDAASTRMSDLEAA